MEVYDMMNRGFGSGQRRGGFKRRFGDRDRGGRFGDRGGDRFGEAKPVKIGEEHTVTITDVGAKGDGIAKINNFIIFVPGAKKGEEIKIKIKEVAGRFAVGEKIGEAEEVHEESVQSSEDSDVDSEDIKEETDIEESENEEEEEETDIEESENEEE